MRRRAGGGLREAVFAGIGLDQLDQLLERSWPATDGCTEIDIRRGGDQRHRREVLDRVVRHLGVHARIDDEAGAHDQDRVAVGRRLATMAMPVLPPAPGMFSTTTCWPQVSDSFCATTRAITSVGPPARERHDHAAPSCSDRLCADAGPASSARATQARRRSRGHAHTAIMASSLDLIVGAIIALARGRSKPSKTGSPRAPAAVASARSGNGCRMSAKKAHAPGPARRRGEIQELGQMGPERRDRHAQLHQRRRTSSRPRSW